MHAHRVNTRAGLVELLKWEELSEPRSAVTVLLVAIVVATEEAEPPGE